MPPIFTTVDRSYAGCGQRSHWPPIATMRSPPFVESEVEHTFESLSTETFNAEALVQKSETLG